MEKIQPLFLHADLSRLIEERGCQGQRKKKVIVCPAPSAARFSARSDPAVDFGSTCNTKDHTNLECHLKHNLQLNLGKFQQHLF